MQLDKLIVVFFVFGGGFLLLRPLVAAIADRIRHKRLPRPDGGEHAEILDEVQSMRQELAELAERVDFTERLLAKQGDAARLAPPR